MAAVILVTGAMASGKSTLGELLAASFDPSVHLRGDVFRRMIMNGRAEPAPDFEPRALAQLRLRYRLSAAAADTYAREGFTVVVQDVVLGPLLGEYVGLVHTRPLHVVVLAPDVATLAAREAGRAKSGYDEAWSIERLDAVLREQTPHMGLWLDSSLQTPAETVEQIIARLDEAAVH